MTADEFANRLRSALGKEIDGAFRESEELWKINMEESPAYRDKINYAYGLERAGDILYALMQEATK